MNIRSMHYIQLQVSCPADFREILIAELAGLEFESFEEFNSGFSAFILEDDLDFEETKLLLETYAGRIPLSYSFQKIARENWNKKWESHYEPVVIDNQVLIKAPFHHTSGDYPFVLEIIPKMSFGTGHHPTTVQVISMLLKFPPAGKSVVDAGSGTGILAIMAEKLGASEVLAFDNDPWCIENGKENVSGNQCRKIRMVEADSVKQSGARPAEVILANINKNILLAEMEFYAQCLQDSGLLFVSGFYTEDIPDLNASASAFSLQLADRSEKDNWACLLYKKCT